MSTMMKMKLAGTVAGLLVAATAMAGCSGTGKDDDTTAKSDFTYAVITHGAPGDAFWDRVKSGSEKAGDKYGVKVNYESDADPAKQSQLIDSAVADKVDGIVVSMANPDGLAQSVKAAVAAGVPVVTINSGQDQSKEFGAFVHIGQDESIAGAAAGEQLKDAGLTKAICVIQEAGNVGLEDRCTAAAKSFGSMENLQVDGTDDNAVQASITSKLQSDPSIDAVLTLGGQYGIDAVAAVKDSGSKAQVGTFDLSEDVVKDVQAGSILFAVDQQPYVQGFLGVTALYLDSINGNEIGGGEPINSGPSFVTKDNADAVLKYAENGTR